MIIPELEELIADLSQKNYGELILEDLAIAKNLRDKTAIVESPSNAGRTLRAKLVPFIKEFGIWKSEEEIYQFIQSINIFLTRRKIKNISEQKDQFIAQAIEAIDDSDKALNIFSSRIREWFGLHFPELDKTLPSHTTFIKLFPSIPGNRILHRRSNNKPLRIWIMINKEF